MAGEEVACPRCGQRLLTPADRRSLEAALPLDGPPPLPRRSIFPELPVTLEPPEGGLRVGEHVPDPKADDRVPRRPFKTRIVAILLILGGVWAFVHVTEFVLVSQGACCLWPAMVLEMVWGLAAVGQGFHLLTTSGRPRPPSVVVLSQLFLSCNFDLVNAFLGFLNILLVCFPECRAYYRDT